MPDHRMRCRQASQLHRHIVATRGHENDFVAFEAAANRCQVVLNLRGDGNCQLSQFPAPGSPQQLVAPPDRMGYPRAALAYGVQPG